MPNKFPITTIPKEVKRLSEIHKSPFLAVDENMLRSRFQQFQKALPDFKLFYAVKTNSHPEIIQIINSAGGNFEISSEGELDLLLRLDIQGNRIISSNPVKSPDFIKAAYQAGVTEFAFDSSAEITKLANHAPNSKIYVRLSVSNERSQWPLSGKFGVEIEEAVTLLTEAAANKLTPYGITFHVGSQCTDGSSWAQAIAKSKRVWQMVADKGIALQMLNIGGGFPVAYTESVPEINEISTVITESLKRTFPEDIKLHVEPGRAFVGEAGILVCTVIGKARRNGTDWLHLDAGVFNGLMESVGGIEYGMAVEKESALKTWTVAGPSCDGFDVISKNVLLPEPEIGEKVCILSAGAYTTVYASEFNGFPIPKVYFY